MKWGQLYEQTLSDIKGEQGFENAWKRTDT